MSSSSAGVAGPVAGGRVAQHIQLLGVLWMVVSTLSLIGGAVLFMLANTLFASGEFRSSGAPHFLQPLLSFIGVLVLAKGTLGFVTGWGLMQRRPWARMLAVVLGFVVMLQIPFGTALGFYTLWVLLSQDAERQYSSLAAA
jgi:hypothetical protein